MGRGLDKRRLVAALVCALACGCTATTDYGGTEFRCARELSCPGGFDCVQTYCVPSGSVDPAVPGRFRRALTIDNGGRDALSGFPVLVALDSSRIDYATAGDGSSLRFTGDDQLTLLPHQIDTWDPQGRSLVWVRLPELAADGNATIYMYWGGDEPPAELAANDTFDDRFVGVWHLDEDPTGEIEDDAAARFPGTAEASMTADNLIAGVLGQALHFDATQNVCFGDQPEFALAAYSWSMWLRGDAAPTTGAGTPLSDAAVQLAFAWNGATLDAVQSASHSDSTGPAPAKIATPLEGAVWYHIGATYDGTNLRVFLDGAVAGSIPAGAPVTADGPLCAGNAQDMIGGFAGDIDELRILSEAVDPDWLEAEHASASDQMVSFGEQEQLF